MWQIHTSAHINQVQSRSLGLDLLDVPSDLKAATFSSSVIQTAREAPIVQGMYIEGSRRSPRVTCGIKICLPDLRSADAGDVMCL
jgi:hypothetical protein